MFLWLTRSGRVTFKPDFATPPIFMARERVSAIVKTWPDRGLLKRPWRFVYRHAPEFSPRVKHCFFSISAESWARLRPLIEALEAEGERLWPVAERTKKSPERSVSVDEEGDEEQQERPSTFGFIYVVRIFERLAYSRMSSTKTRYNDFHNPEPLTVPLEDYPQLKQALADFESGRPIKAGPSVPLTEQGNVIDGTEAWRWGAHARSLAFSAHSWLEKLETAWRHMESTRSWRPMFPLIIRAPSLAVSLALSDSLERRAEDELRHMHELRTALKGLRLAKSVSIGQSQPNGHCC